MMLDPFFRTLKGFEVIIEKEWVSFGYQFQKRCGNFQDTYHEADERSPVFIQFLDCVYQMLEQFPSSFQFNKKLLEFLAKEVYTCQYATFIFDNEWQRHHNEIKMKECVSVWTYVNDN